MRFKNTSKKMLIIAGISLGMAITSFASTGQWVRNNGNWAYKDESGNIVKNMWIKYTDSNWYYVDINGEMHIGWNKVGENWYNFNPSGIMRTGWFQDRGNWYYLDTSKGMTKGWLKINENWYYMDDFSGTMKMGWQRIDNLWYYFSPETGEMYKGWLKNNNNWYYISDTGTMVSNTTIKINGENYTFDDNGVWVSSNVNNNTNSSGTTNNTSNSNLKLGIWSGRTLKNEWSKLSITVPANASIYSSASMKEAVGKNLKNLVNDRNISDLDIVSASVIYDCMIRLGDESSLIQVRYITTTGNSSMSTASSYAAILGEQLEADIINPHTREGIERIEIAGEEYIKLKTTMLGRIMKQDFYIRKLDNYMIVISATYNYQNESNVMTFIRDIKAN
jgi:FOG: Glucan-binding domain (YG repeat)